MNKIIVVLSDGENAENIVIEVDDKLTIDEMRERVERIIEENKKY